MRAVNLLPQAHRAGPRPGAPAGGSYIVLGVLGALLVMALAFTLTANQANSKKSQAASVKQEADQAEARTTSLGAFGSFASITATRTASVKQLASDLGYASVPAFSHAFRQVTGKTPTHFLRKNETK